MIRKLAHLCLVTDRLPAMLDFYTRQMGFAVKFPFVNRDGETFGYYLSCGGSTFIEIFDRVLKNKQWGGDTSGIVPGTQIAHFCFEVTGLAEFRAQQESRGLTVTPIRTGMDQSLQAWTSDPDGNRIEMMEYTNASWQLR